MADFIAELIFIPAPGLGHIMSTVEIAKLFANRDPRISITILVIKPPSLSSGSAITTYIESLAESSLNRISFVELRNDEAQQMRGEKAFVRFYGEYIKSHSKYVRNAVADLIRQPGSGRLAGFVVDMFCVCMMDVANEFSVPTNVFFTSSAGFLGFKLFLQTLTEDLNQDVVELCNSDTEVQFPCFSKPVPTKVFSTVLQTKEGVDFAVESARKLKEVKTIIVNTFFELETQTINSLAADISVPRVYPVGPVLNLEGGHEKLKSSDVITWLDSQPPSSVVFLCFGSMGSFDEVQVKEIAHALERSGHHFLWSLRKPSSDQTSNVPTDYEDPRVVLPEGFLERTHEVGKVIGWAPQVVVLGHRAVGGFVSHCGWNSLLESLWFGVPIATWPMYSEQQLNAFEMVVELGVAVEIQLDYKRYLYNTSGTTTIVSAEKIESGIRGLMENEEIRKKVKEMSRKSREAVAKDGSSYESVGNLIQDFI